MEEEVEEEKVMNNNKKKINGGIYINSQESDVTYGYSL